MGYLMASGSKYPTHGVVSASSERMSGLSSITRHELG